MLSRTARPYIRSRLPRRTMGSSSESDEPLATKISASHVNPQLQSPLFATLYPEIRNLLFTIALTEYDDPTRPYGRHECYYGPGFEFAGRIDTNLLLSCRVVYLETSTLPVALNEHVFWMESRRGPPGRPFSNLDHNTYFGRMTPQQRAAVQRVRFFSQLFWLEGRIAQTWPSALTVRKLAITNRHTDWWRWEDDEPLRMKPPQLAWDSWVRSMPQLDELELELETIESKKEQLEERVQVALGWKFPLEDGDTLVHDGNAPAKSMWVGSSRMAPGPAAGRIAWGLGQPEAVSALTFPLDLKLHARKSKFVRQSRL
ncbi:hypothetical protein C8R47DRAFT_1148794, partial [Mycena vitilis]